jgi:selenocysteine lyase/cysteine desulfurase
MSTTAGPHPSARRSATVLNAARQAVADLVNADPHGVVLGADRAILLSSLAEFGSISLNPYATGPARLEVGVPQFGLLAGVVASIEYLASLDGSATGTRRERLTLSMQMAAGYLNRLFDYLLTALRSLPLVMVIGRPEVRIPVLSFAVTDVPAERVVQRLADNGILANCNDGSRVLDVIGDNDIGGAVTVGLAHYSTTAEVDQLVRTLASLG